MNKRETNRIRRGFTLIELMIAIAIIAVLAALATYAWGKQIRRGRLADMRAMLYEIGSKQQIYEASVGSFVGQTAATYCPATVGTSAVAFDAGACDAVWSTLGVTAPRSTYFQYQILAGTPAGGDDCTAPSDLPAGFNSADVCASISDDTFWWVVIAKADQDGDGEESAFVTSSTMSGRVFEYQSIE
jgi:prepilin-type N-terminal cleavage/methylation domain-containing protein